MRLPPVPGFRPGGNDRCHGCRFFRYGDGCSFNGGFWCRLVDAGRSLSFFHGNAVLFNRCGDNRCRCLFYDFGLHFGFFNLSNRVAYPDFARRHFRRSECACQRHWGLQRVTLITVTAAALAADAQVTR